MTTKQIKLKTTKPKEIFCGIDLSTIYRVLSKPGLYYPRANPTKQGFVSMERLGGSDEYYTVHKSRIHGPLSLMVVFTFTKQGRGHRSLNFILKRLQGKYKNDIVDIEAFMAEYDQSMLEHGDGKVGYIVMNDIICPHADPNQFRRHHVKRILGWYNELIQRSRVHNSVTSNQ